MIIHKWFTLKNNHWQILPHLWWTTEVWRELMDYTWKPNRLCFNCGIAFYWLFLSVGIKISGFLTKNKVSSPFQDCEFTIFFDGHIE